MKAYIKVFVNFEQNNWALVFFMMEITYNNAKNAKTGYTLFELNCGYYSCIFYKEYLNLCSKSKTAKELFSVFWELMTVCQQNFQHTQELQKKAHDKRIKS